MRFAAKPLRRVRVRAPPALRRAPALLPLARSFGVLEDRTTYRSLDPNAGKGAVLTPNKGKKLQCKAVLFDYEVLSMVHDWDEEEYEKKKLEYTKKTGLRDTEIRRVEEIVLQKDASKLLKNEIRDELKKRGLDSTGKPWVLQSRLQEVFNKEKHQDLQGQLGLRLTQETNARENQLERQMRKIASPPAAGGAGKGENAADIRAKYMDALKEKKSRMLQRTMNSGSTGDGEEIFARGGSKSGDGSGGGKWSQNRGANKLLGYLTARGMKAGLLLPPTSSGSIPEADLDNFLGQFAVSLSPVVPALKAEEMLTSNSPTALEEACSQWSVANNQMLFITSERKYLKAARELGVFSCFLTTKNARKPDVRPTYTVLKLKEVQGVIEDLNGISWTA